MYTRVFKAKIHYQNTKKLTSNQKTNHVDRPKVPQATFLESDECDEDRDFPRKDKSRFNSKETVSLICK